MNKILIVDDNQENIDDIKNIIDVYLKKKILIIILIV